MIVLRLVVRMVCSILVIWTCLWLSTDDLLAPVRWGIYLAPFVLGVTAITALTALAMRDVPASGLSALIALIIVAQHPGSLLRLKSPGFERSGFTLTTLSNRTGNIDMAATARMLRDHQADIFALQEISDPPSLLEHLKGLYGTGRPLHTCRRGSYLAISRFPLQHAAGLPGNIAVRCQITLPAGPAQLYLVHLPRALIDTDRQRLAALQLTKDIEGQSDPIIVAGDFNATVLTRTLQALPATLINAFDATGAGTGFSFPTPARRIGALGPFVRIDHVLLSPPLIPLAARAARWHPPGADHFPIETLFTDMRPPS